MRDIIKERRDIFVAGLRDNGFEDIYSRSTFYVWTKIPPTYKSSIDFAAFLLSKKNVVATPGLGFGKYGEGFIRFALTVDKRVLRKVLAQSLLV